MLCKNAGTAINAVASVTLTSSVEVICDVLQCDADRIEKEWLFCVGLSPVLVFARRRGRLGGAAVGDIVGKRPSTRRSDGPRKLAQALIGSGSFCHQR
jgi:hypothetical protein